MYSCGINTSPRELWLQNSITLVLQEEIKDGNEAKRMWNLEGK